MTKISIILPCLNEEESIGASISKIKTVFQENNLNGEIIVVDNGSTDNSAAIAKQFDIVYVFEPKRGYGQAYLAGLKHAKGQYLVLGDPDNSYDFNEIPKFLFHLKTHDVVLGSRFRGHMEKGAMPFLHRYIGNPGLLFLLKHVYGLTISEPSTGFIGLKREIVPQLKLKETGMEFSSELLIKVKKSNFRLKEIPVNYHHRAGVSKFRTWRDGFRHLRFLTREYFCASYTKNKIPTS